MFEPSKNGPLYELIRDRTTSTAKFVLTKTHCGGFCATCVPEDYIETPRSFLKSCLKSRRGAFSPTTGVLRTVSRFYSASLVKKAIHIFRNPMDNIVARFHLERKRFVKNDDKKWLAKYPNSKGGFSVRIFPLRSYIAF